MEVSSRGAFSGRRIRAGCGSNVTATAFAPRSRARETITRSTAAWARWIPSKFPTLSSVGPYLRQLTRSYGETYVRDLGLVASEGRMTIPLKDSTPAGVLDITTHYFEFIPESEGDSPRPTVLGAA